MLQPMALKYSAFAVAAVVVAWMGAVLALESDGLIQGSHLMSCDAVAAQDAAWLHYPRIGMTVVHPIYACRLIARPSQYKLIRARIIVAVCSITLAVTIIRGAKCTYI